MKNIYTGFDNDVCFDGKSVPMTQAAKEVSPMGMSWGYGGSGPYATAHSILAHACNLKTANQYAGAFKFDVIARLPFGERFSLPLHDVIKWVAEHGGPVHDDYTYSALFGEDE